MKAPLIKQGCPTERTKADTSSITELSTKAMDISFG
jgi:hypothetical protein